MVLDGEGVLSSKLPHLGSKDVRTPPAPHATWHSCLDTYGVMMD